MRNLKENLKYLKLKNTLENLDFYFKEAEKKEMSNIALLKYIIKKEVEFKVEKARLSRISRAKIPTSYSIETFPFHKQKHINKNRLLQKYDSLGYILKNKNLIFIGPPGTGKTGLATSFLSHAINEGYTGKFISFYDLIEELYQSHVDHSAKVIVQKYSKVDCLCIDRLGYSESEKSTMSPFFSLIQQRYKKKCTIITTTYGFSDWKSFLHDEHLSAALIDRITDGAHVLNLKNSESLREKPDID